MVTDSTVLRSDWQPMKTELEYQQFLKQKLKRALPVGIDPVHAINPKLFDFQKEIVRWALHKGRAAIFADCGLGKSPMQLEWARQIRAHTGKPVIIFAPLAVSGQTVREGEKFNIKVNHCHSEEDVTDGINITNYERLHRFTDPSRFGAIVLDESSILKGHDRKYRAMIQEFSSSIDYRLACTATPAPNDQMELGTHAEFVGAMTREEMLAMFFVHDGGETQKWRLKGHAKKEFWKWLASWAVALQSPSDIGFDDDGFILPSLNVIDHTVESHGQNGFLFPVEAQGLQERRQARKQSLKKRVEVAADLANSDDGQWLVWCDLNSESESLKKCIEGAVEVKGADSEEHKEKSFLGFADGSIRVLVTKPSIAGFGLNFQNCHNMIFTGLSDSYEQYYQAIRRVWRFGQKEQVKVHVVISEAEGNVKSNIERKEEQATEMMKELVEHMGTNQLERWQESEPYHESKEEGEGWTMYHGDCVEVLKSLKSDSIHYSVFSPPFASLYTYSDSERDMGNCKDDKDFHEHFGYMVDELFRVLMPGRLVSFHCMNLPTSKVRDGVIGVKDFRGDLIRCFQDRGFIYHSEVCIWKDPVTAMQRTKALGLLHKQIKKDSCMSRMGIPDYVVTMRKPGENQERVTHTDESFPVQVWQRYASPIWTDINPSRTLQYRSARENEDERHICPLQLDVIERCIELWTNPGDLVLSPFGGIGSEGHVAIHYRRQYLGIELKESYFNTACNNLRRAEEEAKHEQSDLISIMEVQS